MQDENQSKLVPQQPVQSPQSQEPTIPKPTTPNTPPLTVTTDPGIAIKSSSPGDLQKKTGE
jgi:hypothetical protein